MALVKDKARAEALQERDQASEVVRALHSASGMAPEAIDELRDLLLLQREIQAHKRDPKQYEPPMSRIRLWKAEPAWRWTLSSRQ
jgi:hypothetical protein